MTKDRALADSIPIIILSGLVLSTGEELDRAQIYKFYQKGLAEVYFKEKELTTKTGDDAFLMMWAGLSSTYLKSLKGYHPKNALETIRLHSVRTKFYILHGKKDFNTPVKPVQEFVDANKAHRNVNEPSLDLTLELYDTGHSLGEASDVRLGELITPYKTLILNQSKRSRDTCLDL